MHKTTAERLKYARELRGWTQTRLAVAADVSQGTIGNIESGARQSRGSLPLAAWKPGQALTRKPRASGITGKVHEFTFGLNDTLVAAVGTHRASVSAVLHKLIDIKSNPENSGCKTLVVMDDRHDLEASQRESLVINGVSEVITMTRLQKQAHMPSTVQ